ncbi:PREDICTED: probable carboxylesterase 12 isoform X2 [Lupinus angustifolius]|nr:PREDICTED: probable carboxylesterase 12 isoform X2 [Lupinus angustifolius]
MGPNSISTRTMILSSTGEMSSFFPFVFGNKNIVSLYIKGYKFFLLFFLLFFPLLVSPHRFPTLSRDNDVAFDLSPLIKVYKNGRVERLEGEEVVPPSLVLRNNVESKDVIISNKEGISVRIFMPKTILDDCSNQKQKLPLFVYLHGGAFIIYTPFSPNYHNYVKSVVSKANVIGVSIHYRRAPEHPIPIAYEDSWLALKWVASHVGGNGSDAWLNQHADFEKVFFAGDSAGANLAHQMAIRVGLEGLPGVKLEGVVLANPYFWGVDRIGSESGKEFAPKVDMLWRFASPKSSGSDDPLINPDKDPNLVKLGCKRMLVFVAEKDILKDRGLYYKELLQKRGWNGVVEVIETKGEDHVFHIFKPTSHEALVLLNHVVTFIKHV